MKILVVEDEEITRWAMVTSLESDHRLTIFEARTGAQAVEIAAAEQPDVIILDLILPDSDLDDLTAWLRAIRATVPNAGIAVVSGNRDSANAAVRDGAIEFVGKPVMHAELPFIVHRVCKLAELKAVSRKLLEDMK